MSYSETYFTTRESWRDWRIEAHWLIKWARVAPGARVLELGCGGGGVMRPGCQTSRRGPQLVVTLVAAAALALAGACAPVRSQTNASPGLGSVDASVTSGSA